VKVLIPCIGVSYKKGGKEKMEEQDQTRRTYHRGFTPSEKKPAIYGKVKKNTIFVRPLKRRTNALTGFTLIELLMVMVIIGMLAAIVAPRFMGKVGKAKLQATQVQIELFGAALDSYRLDVGRYPTTEQGLVALRIQPDDASNWDGPYLKKRIPSDPWKNKFVYKSPGDYGEYDIISYGADGKDGGEDEDRDIVSWRGLSEEDDEEE
jgi:general secretion pathway protein G